MSALQLDLVALYIALGALVINTVVGLLLMRVALQQPEIRVLLSPLDAGLGDNAAGGGGTAEGDGSPLEPGTFLWVESDGDRGAGLKPVRQGDAPQVIGDERTSLAGESPALHRNFLDGHRQVAGVDDVDAVRPAVLVGQVDAHEADAQAHGVAADHPPGVEHAERRADHGDGERDPTYPVHGPQHSWSGLQLALLFFAQDFIDNIDEREGKPTPGTRWYAEYIAAKDLVAKAAGSAR